MPSSTVLTAVFAIGLVGAFAIVTALGGVLFGFAFRDLGEFQPSVAFALRWFLSPVVFVALALGIGGRVLSYASLKFFNVSQVTLLSALSIVATLVLARILLREELARHEIFGGALIVAGALLVGR